MSNQQTQAPIKSKIGGQALIEGVMMRGLDKASMAVRLPNGEVDLELMPIKKPSIWSKIPIIRGVINLVSSLILGYKCLSKSAEKSDDGSMNEEELSKFERFLVRKFGDKLMSVITIVGSVLGVIMAIGLFLFIPSLAVQGIDMLIPLGGFKTLVEGVMKIIIFVIYLALVAKMDTIERVYQYHGAEHKSIFCYEKGLPLTVENVKQQSRFHPRCGTSFLIIVLILGILVFSVVTWQSAWLRSLIKLALMPVVVGFSYELIKLAGRYDNWFTRIISFPGIRLQRLTTREPDDSQIEVAIAALAAVIPEDREQDKW